jgi:UDPglucose 6-dehydrogenase
MEEMINEHHSNCRNRVCWTGLWGVSCDFGNVVVCMDTDQKKIDALVSGQIPIYEPGLEEVVQRNVKAGRLTLTTDYSRAMKGAEAVFIAVGTPPADDGSADLRYVESVAQSVAHNMDGYLVIVDKNTVPVGTARKVRVWIDSELASLGKRRDFDVVSNPEFLREGSAVQDFTHPDRVVIGVES